VLFHPAALGAGETDATTLNGWKGCKVNETLVLAVFPALSVAVPLMVCKPDVVKVTGNGQLTTPDKLSEQVKLTVALVAWTIPSGPGAGETVPLITGGVLSMFTVRLVLAL